MKLSLLDQAKELDETCAEISAHYCGADCQPEKGWCEVIQQSVNALREAAEIRPAKYWDMLTLMKHVAKRHNLCPDCLGIGAKTAIYDRDGEDGHVDTYRSNCRTCGMSGKAKS